MIDREQKKRRSNQSLARARLLFRRDLRWTIGFPFAPIFGETVEREMIDDIRQSGPETVRWCVLPIDRGGKIELVTIDRETLRRSELSASKLRNQFFKACRKLFEDSEQWFSRFDDLLVGLKRVIHERVSVRIEFDLQQQAFHTDRQNQSWSEVCESNPEVGRVIRAIQFASNGLTHSTDSSLVSWLATETPALSQLNQDAELADTVDNDELPESSLLQLQLICLHDEFTSSSATGGGVSLQNVVRLLRSQGIRDLHAADPNASIGHLSQTLKLAINRVAEGVSIEIESSELPERESLRPVLLQMLGQALEATGQHRAAIVCLLSQLGDSNYVEQMDRIAQKANAEERRLRSLRYDLSRISLNASGQKNRRFLKPLLAQANAQTLTEKESHFVQCITRIIAEMRTLEPSFVHAICEWFEAARPTVISGTALVNQLLSARFDYSGKFRSSTTDTTIKRILAGLARCVLRSPHSNRLLQAFETRLDNKHSRNFILFDRWLWPARHRNEHALKHLHREPSLAELFALISKLADLNDLPTDTSLFDSMSEVLVAEHDREFAISLIHALNERAPFEWPFSAKELIAAKPFATDPVGLAELMQSIAVNLIDEGDLLQLKPLAACKFGRRLVKKWVRVKADEQIRSFVTLVSTITAAGKSTPTIKEVDRPPNWISNYAEPLHASLIDLCMVSQNAEEAAKRILSQDYVDVGKRRTELAYLMQKLSGRDLTSDDEVKLRQRCQSIERLVEQSPKPSPKRLERLKQKIEDRILWEYERNLKQQLSRQFRDRLAELDCFSTSLDLGDPTRLNLVASILQLSSDLRSLGIRLLNLSIAGKPCPGIEEPENAAFVRRMESLGINLRPWLDSERETRIESKDKGSFTIRFATDPMDYLLMGHHFKTCLAPDGINFYSTVANAVDINKQVLYGRDEVGRIIGRCLLTLGVKGELSRYNAYAHDRGREFEAAVDEFVDALAIDMKTLRSQSSKVENLVAPRWYDDGCVGRAGNQRDQLEAYVVLVRETSLLESPGDVNKEALSDAINSVASAYGLSILVEQTIGYGQTPPALWVVEMVWSRLGDANASFETMLLLADHAYGRGQPQFLNQLISAASRNEILRAFRRSRCGQNGCYRIHLASVKTVEAILQGIDAHTALQAMRGSRGRSIRSDLSERSPDRRRLLADIHQRLGRKNLPAQLRSC